MKIVASRYIYSAFIKAHMLDQADCKHPNVVASATVNQTVNLNLITQIFPDVEYHPDQFPGLVFRLRSPKTATLIFAALARWSAQAPSQKRWQFRRSRALF